MIEPQVFFTTKEAAELIRVKPKTLEVWRNEARGPCYLKFRASVRYCREDLVGWMIATASQREAQEASAECHNEQRLRTKRLRGRAGRDQHERRLKAEPHCRDCLEEGIIRASTETDHIFPLALGGTDHDRNIRCLCAPCHAVRTRETRARVARAKLSARAVEEGT